MGARGQQRVVVRRIGRHGESDDARIEKLAGRVDDGVLGKRDPKIVREIGPIDMRLRLRRQRIRGAVGDLK